MYNAPTHIYWEKNNEIIYWYKKGKFTKIWTFYRDENFIGIVSGTVLVTNSIISC